MGIFSRWLGLILGGTLLVLIGAGWPRQVEPAGPPALETIVVTVPPILATPTPTRTPTPRPTNTPLPPTPTKAPPQATPTSTPLPQATPTPRPPNTPVPTVGKTGGAAPTPSPTPTPVSPARGVPTITLTPQQALGLGLYLLAGLLLGMGWVYWAVWHQRG